MFTEQPSCTTRDLDPRESEVPMPRKSSKKSEATETLDDIEDGNIEESMIVYVTRDGERVYLHTFESRIHALEFLEIMVAGLRADILESLETRSLN